MSDAADECNGIRYSGSAKYDGQRRASASSFQVTHRDLALLTAAQRPFTRPGWLFELKYDGFRCPASKMGGLVRMLSRNGRGLGHAFPELVDELHDLPDGTVIDGELVVLDERGHSQFEQLSARAFMEAIRERPAAILSFDVLVLDGRERARP